MRKTANIVSHYVPKFYLRQWCNENDHLWVHPIDGSEPFKSKPKNFAAIRGLYDSSEIEGIEDVDTESDLSVGEGLFARVWPDIFERIKFNPKTKRNLSRFIAQSVLRRPSHNQTIRDDFHRLKTGLEDQELGPDDEFVVNLGEGDQTTTMREFFNLDQDTDDFLQFCFLGGMRRSLEDIADIFASRTWGVIVSPEPVFVTGDFPIGLFRGTCERPTFAYGTKGTEVVYPLSPTKLLMMNDDFREDGLIYPLEDVGTLNYGVCGASERFVFSATEEIPGVSLLDP